MTLGSQALGFKQTQALLANRVTLQQHDATVVVLPLLLLVLLTAERVKLANG